MTPAGYAASVLHGLALFAAAAYGARCLDAGDTRQAAVFYALALTCLIATFREASRAELEPDREPGRLAGWWLRRRATRQASRILRTTECTCDAVWWPSAQHPHAPYCPSAQTRSNP